MSPRVFAGNGWALGTSTNAVIYPVQVTVGDVVTGANLYVQRTNSAAALVAQLQRVDNATGLRLPLSASVLENSGTTGSVVVPLPALISEPLDGAYTVAVAVAGLGVDGIVVGNVAVARTNIKPTRTLEIGAPVGLANHGGPPFHGRWWDASIPFYVYFPITLPVGCTIKSWQLSVLKYSPGGRIEATLESEHAFTDGVIGTAQVLVGSPGPALLGATVNVPVEADHTYYVRVASTEGATGPDLFHRLRVTYTEP